MLFSATCCSKWRTRATETLAASNSPEDRAEAGGHPIFDLDIVSVTLNGAVTIQAPQGRGAAAPGAAATGGPTAEPPTEKLGEGIYLILGGYACLAIESRTTSWQLRVRRARKGDSGHRASQEAHTNKPIRYVVNTHAHIDHSSGSRAFVAEGVTILTHQNNKAYLEKEPYTERRAF